MPFYLGAGRIYIRNNDALLNTLHINESTLNDIIDNKEDYYSEFEVPKKNGVRTIYAIVSGSALYECQKKLLNTVFSKFQLSPCAKGFIKGKNYRSFLEEHIGNEFFVRYDIKNFFGSITQSMLETKLNEYYKYWNSDSDAVDEIVNNIVEICTLGGSLPQGAVTSPHLSNFVFSRTDQRIMKYCQKVGVRYTRYADDLLFSSSSLDFEQKDWFYKKIRFILSDTGFKLNNCKTRYSQQQISLNGFVVGNDVHLSRKRLSGIVSLVRACEENKQIIISKDWVKLLTNIKQLNRHDITTTFENIPSLLLCLIGYRAYLISWLSPDQKRLSKIIRRIEINVTFLSKHYYSNDS